MKKYSQLLERYDDLRQYSITFPSDYSEKIAADVGKIMNIQVDTEMIHKMIWTDRSKQGEENICLFKDTKDERCFILLDCNPFDWIFSMSVRCTIDSSEKVSEVMLYWLNYCLREEKQVNQYDRLDDDMFNDSSFLLETIRRHSLDKY